VDEIKQLIMRVYGVGVFMLFGIMVMLLCIIWLLPGPHVRENQPAHSEQSRYDNGDQPLPLSKVKSFEGAADHREGGQGPRSENFSDLWVL